MHTVSHDLQYLLSHTLLDVLIFVICSAEHSVFVHLTAVYNIILSVLRDGLRLVLHLLDSNSNAL